MSAVGQDAEFRYDAGFWAGYIASAALMTGVSLLFHYGAFVRELGGSEGELGLIVGVGAVGGVLLRFVQGSAVDRYGVRGVWMLSLAAAIVGCWGQRWVTNLHSPLVYICQTLYRAGIAGAFGCSITFVSLRAGPARMAEAVGTLGSSGFLAQLIGPRLGDAILGTTPDRTQLEFLFAVSAGLMVLSLSCASLALWITPPLPMEHNSNPNDKQKWRARLRFAHLPLLVVGVMMGIGIALPGVFVKEFARTLQLKGIATFFTGYAVAAFTSRILTRRFPERYGERTMILAGMTSLTLGMLLFPLVRNEWWLIAPALCMGNAHSWLFPSIITGGSRRFPRAARGLGTALMLATMDLGGVLGSPLFGGAVELARACGWPAYPTAFLATAALFMLSAIGFSQTFVPTPANHEPADYV